MHDIVGEGGENASRFLKHGNSSHMMQEMARPGY